MAFDPLAPVRFGFRIGIGVLRFELDLIERILGLDRPEPSPAAAEPEPAVVTEPYAAPPPPAPPRPEPASAPPAPPRPEPVSAPPQPPRRLEPDAPRHLDTEPELVGEFAEPGAEEGAGAQIRVEEPWPGYRRMQVTGILDRIAVASAEELAVAQLYEATHRRRRTVLDAVQRRMKVLANAPAR
jgi:hypothetical protein